MNLEALPKYYSPKSPKLSDDAPATGSGGLTITDVMAAQGMVQSKAPLGFALFLAKVGVQDPQFAIEGLLNYAMALDNPTLNKLSEETRLQIIPYLVNFAFADYSRSAASKARCEHCAGTGFHNVLREVVKHSRSGESVIKEEWVAGTNEFIGEGDAYIPPHTGLPANSTDIAPPDIPAGFVAVFNSDESSWHLVEDHRGKTVYDVASGDALFISELGSLPENVTWLSPEGEFQQWNGTAWVKDAEAEKLFRIREAEETKNSLMQAANEHIAPLQDAVDLEIATEEEASLLAAWKKYRVLLNRVDTSVAPDIEWPAVPVME